MEKIEKNELVCTICPVSCHLVILEDKTEESGYKVETATCKRGIQCGIKELTNPTRLISSTVKFSGNDFIKRLPVRTDIEIPKEKIRECMDVINYIEVHSDVKMGDVLAENICQTDANIIASRTVTTNLK